MSEAALETICPGCGRKLRVGAEHAGKSARCPVCSTIYTVSKSNESAAAGPEQGTDLWRMKTPDGQTYGPIRRETLDQWVSEGRVSDNCEVLQETDGQWRNAADVYPVLRPVRRGVMPGSAPGQPEVNKLTDNVGANPAAGRRVVNPHLAGLVLALGVLSWAVGCPILGIMAWVMGSSDLREMEQGVMDRSGMSMTQAGQIIGMISTILFLVGFVLFLVGVLVLGILS